MLQNAGAKIHFIHYASEAEWRQKLPAAAQHAMMEEWDGYYLVPPTRDLHSYPNDGNHHTIDEWWDPQLEATLTWLGEKIKPDVAIVNYTWLSRALEFVPQGTLKVLDTHDKFSGRKELLASYQIAPEFFYTTEEQEKIALDRADVVWAIKDEERLLFQDMTDRQVITVPHADPATPLPARPLPEDPEDFELRIGVMGAKNSINTQNLMRFLDVAGPLFRKHLPPLKIVIGGTICELLEHLDLPFVEKIGWVEDVTDFYTDIDVALVPMEFSTGLKIKTSEAMTFGLPILSHAHAFEGYTPFHRYQALASFQDLVEACIDLAYEGPAALEQHRQATAGSHRSVIRQMQDGINATGEAILKAQTYTLICPTAAVAERGSLYESLARSNITYLSYRGPVALYFDEISDAAGLSRFCAGAPSSQIYVNAGLRDGLAAHEQGMLEDAGVRWSSFEALLSKMQICHLWLDQIPADPVQFLKPAFDRIYLNTSTLRRAELGSAVDGCLDALTGPFTEVTVLGSADSPWASHLRSRLGAEQVNILPFWGKEFPMMWDLTPPPAGERYGVTVILEEYSPAIIKTISEVASVSGQPLLNLILLDQEGSELQRVYRNGMDIRYFPPGAVNRRNLSLLRGVSTTVNFAPSSLFALMLTSILSSAGQDVWTAKSSYDSASEKMEKLTLLNFMRELQSRLRSPRDSGDAGDRFAALFQHDPGWALIWGQAFSR